MLSGGDIRNQREAAVHHFECGQSPSLHVGGINEPVIGMDGQTQRIVMAGTEQPAAGAGNGITGVKAPPSAMLRETTDWAMWSPTKRNFPEGSAASPMAEAKPAELAVLKGDPETGVRTPLAPIWNEETVFRSEVCESGKLLANSTVPAELIANPKGLAAPKGEPATGESEPFAAIRKTEMLSEAWFATKINLPSGSTAMPVGRAPVIKGVPGTGVSMPVLELTEKADTVFAPWLLTKRNLCTASKAMNSAPAPAGNGDPFTSESEPDVLTAKTET